MLNSKPGRQRAPRARTRGAGPRMLAESGEAHRRTRASRMQASGHAYETPQTTHSPDGSVASRAALFARRHAGTPARPCLRLPLVPTLLMALPPPSSSHADVAPPSVRHGAQRHRPSCAHHSARARAGVPATERPSTRWCPRRRASLVHPSPPTAFPTTAGSYQSQI